MCRIVRGLECIVVDRKASGAQDRVLEAIRERATSCTRPILIFPEGANANANANASASASASANASASASASANARMHRHHCKPNVGHFF
jgi:hypothetical protein